MPAAPRMLWISSASVQRASRSPSLEPSHEHDATAIRRSGSSSPTVVQDTRDAIEALTEPNIIEPDEPDGAALGRRAAPRRNVGREMTGTPEEAPPAPGSTRERRCTTSYDRRRLAWWARFEALVRLGELRGARVLDRRLWYGSACRGARRQAIGCRAERRDGAGRERAGAARRRDSRGSCRGSAARSLAPRHPSRRARASQRRLAFSCRAVASLVATARESTWTLYWGQPGLSPQSDRQQFPPGQLAEELTIAGFDTMRLRADHSHTTITREHALERRPGARISTFDLLDAAELEEGTATPSATFRPMERQSRSSSSSLPRAD